MNGKLAYFESPDELKSRNIDKQELIDVKNCFNIDIEESEFNRTHRIVLKINKIGKVFEQIIVKFKGFVPRTKVCRARKHKVDIAINLDLTKRRYLLLKDVYGKAKNCASVDFACSDINYSHCL